MDTLMITFPLPSLPKYVKSLAEPNRTKSYKLAWVLNKNLESFPSAMFPCGMKLKWTLKKLNLQKIFKQRVINIYLENYERFKCEKT